MRALRSHGPFSERPYFTDAEIESLASEELRGVDLFPSSPGPVRIERFIEKRFGVTPRYDPLPESVLGLTRFSRNGVEQVIVSRALTEQRTKVAERRINTTLAHEAGHGLVHGHLFALGAFNHSLFDEDKDVQPGKVLCRNDGVGAGRDRAQGYDGRWWEYQANRVMGALLLPRELVVEAVEQFLEATGSLGMMVLPGTSREEAARQVSDVFDVNPVVGRIRLSLLYPGEEKGQLTL